jgi:hypothetical protein
MKITIDYDNIPASTPQADIILDWIRELITDKQGPLHYADRAIMKEEEEE